MADNITNNQSTGNGTDAPAATQPVNNQAAMAPEFYVCMAKAWLDDKHAEPDKTALYYDYIVRK